MIRLLTAMWCVIIGIAVSASGKLESWQAGAITGGLLTVAAGLIDSRLKDVGK